MTNFLNNLWNTISGIPQRFTNWWNGPQSGGGNPYPQEMGDMDEVYPKVQLPNFRPVPTSPTYLDESLVAEREPFYGGGARNRPPSPSRYFDDRLDTDKEPLYGGSNPWQPQQPQPYKSFNGPWDDVAPYQPPPKGGFVKPRSGPRPEQNFWENIRNMYQ